MIEPKKSELKPMEMNMSMPKSLNDMKTFDNKAIIKQLDAILRKRLTAQDPFDII